METVTTAAEARSLGLGAGLLVAALVAAIGAVGVGEAGFLGAVDAEAVEPSAAQGVLAVLGGVLAFGLAVIGIQAARGDAPRRLLLSGALLAGSLTAGATVGTLWLAALGLAGCTAALLAIRRFAS